MLRNNHTKEGLSTMEIFKFLKDGDQEKVQFMCDVFLNSMSIQVKGRSRLETI